MNKSELIDAIAKDAEITKAAAKKALESFVANVTETLKKKDGKDVEVQDGWIGRVIPFELVQQTLLKKRTG